MDNDTPEAAPEADVRIVEVYEEIPKGDGIMRAEPGDFVVPTADGSVVMPPARYAEMIAGNE